jgi:fibronectin type 3 domain-containing protein
VTTDTWYGLIATFKGATTSGSSGGTTHSVALSWVASTTAGALYNVYRSTVSGGPYSGLAAKINATTYADQSVADGTTYYYVVTAVCGPNSANCAGESSPSNEVSATIPAAASTAPASPSGLSATVQ